MNGNVVKVTLWGDTVGYLAWDSSDWRNTSSVFSFFSNFREYCSAADISKQTCDIMQKELNEKYNSFNS